MHQQANMKLLAERGLNMVAVFALADLPHDIRARLAAAADISRFRQVILVAHGGRRLWSALEERGAVGPDPVDHYSVRTLEGWFADELPEVPLEILYPLRDSPVPLVELGTLAGWHHSSPFRIGINDAFGSWFAYRALVLVDSQLPVTASPGYGNPCASCLDTPCIKACPAGAVQKGGFDAPACYDHRLAAGSSCAAQCLARAACPIGRDHAYGPDQTSYHYGRSLDSLRKYRDEGLI